MAKRFLLQPTQRFLYAGPSGKEEVPRRPIVRNPSDENRVSISDAMRIYLHEPNLNEVRHGALQVKYLSASWRRDSASNSNRWLRKLSKTSFSAARSIATMPAARF